MLFLLLPVVMPAQEHFEVRDRRGVTVLILDNITLFRYSDYFKMQIPEFVALMTNLTKEDLLDPVLLGIIHKQDGSQVKFPAYPAQDIPKDLTQAKVGYSFLKPWPFSASNEVVSIEFRLETARRRILVDGFHFSGFSATDEGCLKDYLAARTLQGVALRKRLAELVSYNCGVVIDPPMAATHKDVEKKTLQVAGKRVQVAHALFWDEAAFVRGTDHRTPEVGWVVLDEMKPERVLTTEDIGVGTE